MAVETAAKIRVLIADDHEMVREGLRLFLDDTDDLLVLGAASDSEEALRLTRELQPDVLLLDLRIPPRDGIEIARIVRAENLAAAILILTSFADDEKVKEAVQAGVAGFLMKDIARGELVHAIRAAAAGRPTLHPAAQEALMRQMTAARAPDPFALLTDRERDVLQCLADGCSNKEIAVRLRLTVGTVKGYVSAILVKLEVADRTQAALYAERHRIH